MNKSDFYIEQNYDVISKVPPFGGDLEGADLYKIASSEVFQKLRSLKLIDETELRNLKIRNEYKELRNSFTASTSIQILSEKYSLSDSTLNNILFRKRILKLKLPVVFS